MRWIILYLFILFQSLNRVEGQNNTFSFIEEGKIGFKDDKDSIWITPVYDFSEASPDGYKWTVVGYGDYERLSNNASERQIKFTGKFGFVGDSGDEIFSPQFDMFFRIFEDHAIVGNGEGHLIYNDWPEGKSTAFEGKIGVVNKVGYISVPIRFHEIKTIKSDNKSFWFTLDDEGKSSLYLDSILIEIPGNISNFSDFSNGLAKVQIDQKFGFIDTIGNVKVQPVLDRAKDYSKGKAFVRDNNRYYWIDTFGKEIEGDVSIIFDEMDDFSEGYARVKIFGQFGFIKPDSSFYKLPRFSEATPFFNEISSVASLDSFGYVYTNGVEDIAKKYEGVKILESSNRFSNDKWKNDENPSVDFKDSVYFFKPFDTLTFDKFISFHAEALRWAPYLYYNYPQMLPKVSAGEGTLVGRFLFNVPFLKPGCEVWEYFKHNILLRLLGDEKSRSLLWKYIKPMYKSSFQSMPELHQQVYTDMISYLEEYFNNYDIEQTREFLSNNESFFAHEHPDGSISPFRKASAQIDRLILVYEVISIEDVQRWIRKIKKEINKW